MSALLKIPEKNREIFCSLSPQEISGKIEENSNLLNQLKFKIAGVDGRDFRESCKEELLALTFMNTPSGESRRLKEKKIILSGHQPLLNHPGVWIKIFLLDFLAREVDALGVNLEVDSDAAGSLNIPFPRKDNHLKVVRENMIPEGEGMALESVPAPEVREWNDFMGRAVEHVKTLPNPKIAERVIHLARMGSQLLKSKMSLSNFFVRLRQQYEGPANLDYASLNLSSVCSAKSFLYFFLDIAGDAEKFSHIYNSGLEDYRIRHKFRYKANPFPDLEVRDGIFELPFWWIDKTGARKPLFASKALKSGKEKISLTVGGKEDFVLDMSNREASIRKISEEVIKIRPKALALTIFFRLFFCDLFIHGISGAKYDEAADYIIKKYYGSIPPHYLAASLTLYPDLGVDGLPEGEEERVKTRMREMKFKPEKFADLVSGKEEREKFLQIVEQKRTLLGNIQKGEKDKKIFQEMDKINETLFLFLEFAHADCVKQMGKIQKKREEEKALRFREYPYCFFDPLDLQKTAGGY